ncbi:uncharacterized protein DS421_20g700320 [Arachis hypogaea]|nr:uncharacterized protein DS421_20g700320 [Arachis hypogaea]
MVEISNFPLNPEPAEEETLQSQMQKSIPNPKTVRTTKPDFKCLILNLTVLFSFILGFSVPMKIYRKLRRSTPLRPNRILLLATGVQSLTSPADFEPYSSASRLDRILAANMGANSKAAERIPARLRGQLVWKRSQASMQSTWKVCEQSGKVRT